MNVFRIETHEEWIERLQSKRQALRKGIFAYSPDPIVFGPNRLKFSDLGMLEDSYFHLGDCHYIDTYRRCDYPDLLS